VARLDRRKRLWQKIHDRPCRHAVCCPKGTIAREPYHDWATSLLTLPEPRAVRNPRQYIGMVFQEPHDRAKPVQTTDIQVGPNPFAFH